MGRLIRTSGSSAGKPGATSIFVESIRYANAAAKFWPNLIDEIAEEFPSCDRFELAAVGSGMLDKSLLFPELSLEKTIDEMKGRSIRDVMSETLAELELLGPPTSVKASLFHHGNHLLDAELPLECVDSETFPHLFVWPIEWARIARETWNNSSVEGEFTANDKTRGIIYACSLRLENEHISEGLYRRRLSIGHSVSILA